MNKVSLLFFLLFMVANVFGFGPRVREVEFSAIEKSSAVGRTEPFIFGKDYAFQGAVKSHHGYYLDPTLYASVQSKTILTNGHMVAAVQKEDKWSILYFDGVAWAEPIGGYQEISWITALEGGKVVASVEKEGKWSILYFDGKTWTEPIGGFQDILWVTALEGGKFVAAVKKDDKYSILYFDGSRWDTLEETRYFTLHSGNKNVMMRRGEDLFYGSKDGIKSIELGLNFGEKIKFLNVLNEYQVLIKTCTRVLEVSLPDVFEMKNKPDEVSSDGLVTVKGGVLFVDCVELDVNVEQLSKDGLTALTSDGEIYDVKSGTYREVEVPDNGLAYNISSLDGGDYLLGSGRDGNTTRYGYWNKDGDFHELEKMEGKIVYPKQSNGKYILCERFLVDSKTKVVLLFDGEKYRGVSDGVGKNAWFVSVDGERVFVSDFDGTFYSVHGDVALELKGCDGLSCISADGSVACDRDEFVWVLKDGAYEKVSLLEYLESGVEIERILNVSGDGSRVFVKLVDGRVFDVKL